MCIHDNGLKHCWGRLFCRPATAPAERREVVEGRFALAVVVMMILTHEYIQPSDVVARIATLATTTRSTATSVSNVMVVRCGGLGFSSGATMAMSYYDTIEHRRCAKVRTVGGWLAA